MPPSAEDEADEWLERTYDETDTIILHRFFEKHADKIGKELLSSSKVSAEKMTPEAEAAAANGKRAWDALCAALVDLGQPLESPKLSMFNSREHREYLDLMMRCDRRDTNTVQELFVEAIGSPVSLTSCFWPEPMLTQPRMQMLYLCFLYQRSTWKFWISNYCYIISSRYVLSLQFFQSTELTSPVSVSLLL